MQSQIRIEPGGSLSQFISTGDRLAIDIVIQMLSGITDQIDADIAPAEAAVDPETDPVLPVKPLVQQYTKLCDPGADLKKGLFVIRSYPGEKDQAGITPELEDLSSGRDDDAVDPLEVVVYYAGDELDPIATLLGGFLGDRRESGNIQKHDPRKKLPAIWQGAFWQALGKVPDESGDIS